MLQILWFQLPQCEDLVLLSVISLGFALVIENKTDDDTLDIEHNLTIF